MALAQSYCNGDCSIFNITSEIYRRLNFRINTSDEPIEGPGECVLLKEVAVGGPTRKLEISDVSTSEEGSNSV